MALNPGSTAPRVIPLGSRDPVLRRIYLLDAGIVLYWLGNKTRLCFGVLRFYFRFFPLPSGSLELTSILQKSFCHVVGTDNADTTREQKGKGKN